MSPWGALKLRVDVGDRESEGGIVFVLTHPLKELPAAAWENDTPASAEERGSICCAKAGANVKSSRAIVMLYARCIGARPSY